MRRHRPGTCGTPSGVGDLTDDPPQQMGRKQEAGGKMTIDALPFKLEQHELNPTLHANLSLEDPLPFNLQTAFPGEPSRTADNQKEREAYWQSRLFMTRRWMILKKDVEDTSNYFAVSRKAVEDWYGRRIPADDQEPVRKVLGRMEANMNEFMHDVIGSHFSLVFSQFWLVVLQHQKAIQLEAQTRKKYDALKSQFEILAAELEDKPGSQFDQAVAESEVESESHVVRPSLESQIHRLSRDIHQYKMEVDAFSKQEQVNDDEDDAMEL